MIFSKRDLENHFFVGTIETKNIYGFNYDAVKKEVIHRIFCGEKKSIGSSFSWSYWD